MLQGSSFHLCESGIRRHYRPSLLDNAEQKLFRIFQVSNNLVYDAAMRGGFTFAQDVKSSWHQFPVQSVQVEAINAPLRDTTGAVLRAHCEL